jgi:hypothetical protein
LRIANLPDLLSNFGDQGDLLYADSVAVTGPTTFAEAVAILRATGDAPVTFDNVSMHYSQVAALPIGANDIVSAVTISGLVATNFSALIDLSAYDAGTAITFAGGDGAVARTTNDAAAVDLEVADVLALSTATVTVGANGYNIVDGASAILAQIAADASNTTTFVADAVARTTNDAAAVDLEVADVLALSTATVTVGANGYNIVDTATALANTSDAIRNSATDITVSDVATLTQSVAIDGATNSGTTTYSVEDTFGTLQTALDTPASVTALQNAQTVTATSTTQSEIDLSGFSGSNEVDLIVNGNFLANQISTGSGDDTINAGGGNDVIYGGAGDDIIYGEGGTDTFIFSTTNTLNGSDTVKDFTSGETILFAFGNPGELDQSDLHGNGINIQIQNAGEYSPGSFTLGSNTGLVLLYDTHVLGDASQAINIVSNYDGLTSGSKFYLAVNNQTDTSIFLMSDSNNDANIDSAELIATFEGVGDATDLQAAMSQFVIA